MARKPKVQAVVDEGLHAQFQQWQIDNGYSNEGEAIRAILKRVILGDITDIPRGDNSLEDRLNALEERLGNQNDSPKIKELDQRLTALEDRLEERLETLTNSFEFMIEKKLEGVKDTSDIPATISGDTSNIEINGKPPQDGNEEASPSDSTHLYSKASTNKEDNAEITPKATDDPLIQLHLLIADHSQYWCDIAKKPKTQQSRAIADFLIEHGFKEEGYSLSPSYMNKWSDGNYPKNPKAKHYLASKIYDQAILPNLSY